MVCLDFSDYVATLPDWEAAFLRSIRFFYQPHKIVHQLDTLYDEDPPLLVSHGSALLHQTMSFGLVFGLADGTVLLEHSGPAYGIPLSFRAEATGQLSGLLLLHHLQPYTLTVITICITSSCDNAGLIQRIQARKAYDVSYPTSTLVSDWDLTEQIHQVITRDQFPSIQFEWVKGHQDDLADHTSQLSVAACFNVRADSLASEYMQDHPELRPRVLLLPAMSCVFELDGVSVTSQYISSIRRAASHPDMVAYLIKTHKWTPAIFAQVDWDVFRTAACHYSKSSTHFMKLVHDYLPTLSHKAKFQPWVSSECPHCGLPEKFDHIMQCSNPISTEFWQRLFKSVTEYGTRNHLSPEFTALYCQVLSLWLQPHDHAPDLDMFPSQGAIGWRLFVRGFIFLEWRRYLTRPIQVILQCTKEFLVEACWVTFKPPSRSHSADPVTILSGLVSMMSGRLPNGARVIRCDCHP